MSAHRTPRPNRSRRLRAALGVSAVGAALAVAGTLTAQAAQDGGHPADRPAPAPAHAHATPSPVPSPVRTGTPSPVPSPARTGTPSPVPSPVRPTSPAP
ncbi:hypothetical protein ADL04_16200, partial [Streptomyces sp. NRRL B-3648]